jgi:hypothetical protein
MNDGHLRQRRQRGEVDVGRKAARQPSLAGCLLAEKHQHAVVTLLYRHFIETIQPGLGSVAVYLTSPHCGGGFICSVLCTVHVQESRL